MRTLSAISKTYIPRFNGNQELPEEEQFVVTYRVPDLQLKSRLKPKPKLKFNYDAAGNTTGGETELSTDRMTVVSGMLISIRNLSWADGKTVHEVAKASDLLKAPVEYEALIDELHEEFSKELDRTVDEKN
jgi:hypothetical protein